MSWPSWKSGASPRLFELTHRFGESALGDSAAFSGSVLLTGTSSSSANTQSPSQSIDLNQVIDGLASPPIGLVFVGDAQTQRIEVWGNGDSRRTRLLHQASIGQKDAVLLGRLYYSEEWRSRLRSRVPNEALEQSERNHALLALHVYRGFGEEGLAQLEGDFALICSDRFRRRVVAARDQGGGYQLFWQRSGGTLMISTAIESLRRMQPSNRLNLGFASDLLGLPGACFDEVPTNETVWEGIERLERGTLLTASLNDSQPVRIQRQQVNAACPDLLADASLEECSSAFVEQLELSVKVRLGQTNFAQVSGGFDSTLCAALASRQRQSGSEPIHGLSMLYHRHPGLAVEHRYVDAAYQSCPSLIRHDINADDVLDFDGFTQQPSFGEPYPYLAHLPMELAMINEASKHGATAMLSGSGGDGVATTSIPVVIATLLCKGDIKEALRTARAFGRARSVSPCRFISEAIGSLMPLSMQSGWHPFLRGGRACWSDQTDWTIAPWIRPRFARQFHLRDRIGSIHRRIHGSTSLNPLQRYHHGLRSGGRVNFARWYHAAETGMVVSHPFLDPRLIALAENIHWRHRVIPGQQKPLLASAANDLLPDQIRNRKGKGHFDEVYFRGLARHRPQLERLIESSSPSVEDVIDRSKLLDCLRKASLGATTDIRATDKLNLTLSLLSWLSSRADTAP